MPKAKKQSKTRKVLNWLNPTSPAKGMLLVAITFAVIGGSYMAFKSFAATADYTYEITVPYLTINQPSRTFLWHDPISYGSSKSGTDSILLTVSGNPPLDPVTHKIPMSAVSVTAYNSNAALVSKGSNLYQLDFIRQHYKSERTCVVVRIPSGQAPTNIQIRNLFNASGFWNEQSILVPSNGNTYHEVCDDPQNINSSTPIMPYAGVSNYDLAPNYQVFLYSIKIEAYKTEYFGLH